MGGRYKTGENAPEKGTYEFDGLVNEGNENEVIEDEKYVELESGETFPPIRSNKEAAYWKKVK
ncbi:YjzC family protein [Halobacillus salinarum]|uniref:YjzC family protein n=1 Tax=Halobacillus salinarum TaxID=2932257 RepID=A0ABY4EPL5_9BACI|nr:YjzC family protein [Halobacillus salinarum]UOQ45935.1 YjzC family protein [Halobacillus salinarum]